MVSPFRHRRAKMSVESRSPQCRSNVYFVRESHLLVARFQLSCGDSILAVSGGATLDLGNRAGGLQDGPQGMLGDWAMLEAGLERP